MKLKKSQIKELIRHAIIEASEEEEKPEPSAPKPEKEKPTTDISDNPFDDKESVEESKKRRFTVKEVRAWMKKLEENRYKKVYHSDARRVAWMVNNEGVSLDEMPMSMKKKWNKAQYGRERYLATEFLKSKSEQMNESKLRGMIRGIIEEQIRHTNARFLYVPKNDFKKAKNIFKSDIKKGKVEIEPKPSPKVKGFYRMTVNKQDFDNYVEELMMKRINVKTIAKGKA